MAFVSDSRIIGLVYKPDTECDRNKKHPCSDCFSCQHCSDIKCELCLKRNARLCPGNTAGKERCGKNE